MFWQAYRYILQNMDKKDSHIELLDRFFRGLTSPEEDVQLKSWIKQPDFQQKFSAYYQQCWALAPDTMDKAVQNEMFTELLSQIDASSTTETKVLKTRNRFLRQIGRYAAVACIILAVGSGAYYAGVKRPADDANTEVTMSVSNGQKADIILADGTKVYINSDSRIVYDNTYNKKTRMVSLEGEAYFEVAKNPDKRFIVEAKGMQVEALGTSFNVNAYQNDNKIIASLFSGSVRVSYDRHVAILKPHESVKVDLLNRSFSRYKDESMQNIALWRKNEITFDGEPLEEITHIMSRLYNTTICIEDESLKKVCYIGTIRNNNLENFIDIINLTTPVVYENKGDTVFLRKRVP